MPASTAAGVAAVIAMVGVWTAPPAAAIEPPQVPPGPPPSGAVAPAFATEQKAQCGVGAALPGSQFARQPAADSMLDYTAAWAFSRGAGQRVAVIDTGVAPNVRLPRLEAGGDYVSSSDGLVDCDAHGTLVAGLIAAIPGSADAFAGVAPEATILSIRQFSGAYSAAQRDGTTRDPSSVSAGVGDTRTLALAVTRAVDLGATVINISAVACAPVGSAVDDADLGRALRYAFERNVVTVVAAGDVDDQNSCAQNDVGDPNRPLADAWQSVRSIASPPWFAQYTLTVGSVAPNAQPSSFSLHGPWVGVAAPGEQLTSLNPNGTGVGNALMDPQKGPVPINGTGYAAPLVSGVVALVRSKFPNLSAAQVIDRIERTARTPDGGPNAETGYGLVDPVAALTYDVMPASHEPDSTTGHQVAAPPPSPTANPLARNAALAVCGICVVGVAGIAGLKGAAVRRKRAHTEQPAEPR